MKIGYPSLNRQLPTSSKTFRLASYSDERFLATIESNLTALETILRWNKERNLLFFRISSDIIPFASHEICQLSWQTIFKPHFQEIGKFIQDSKMRISMHPDQFVLINSPSEDIFTRSVAELLYHATVLELLELDSTHKMQIHVGGAYGDKETSIKRFITRYKTLPKKITDRLVIENDERLFSLQDCLEINQETGVPVLLDTLHHQINSNGESIFEALQLSGETWKEKDGVPMIDYSEQEASKRIGAHREHIEVSEFKKFLQESHGLDRDIMLEIKDKESSALEAIKIIDSL
jgi:UV DNA damage endonuclease